MRSRWVGTGLSGDFYKFWAGETVSNLGSSITVFVFPLLVFKLTGSALNLGIAGAASMLPYLFFGLPIGAWVDRVDRKRLMIGVDLASAIVIATIPAAAGLGWLSVWWIYAVAFVSSTLGIFFSSAEFAAIPSLVRSDDLVTGNGRIQATFSAAGVAGPLLAGLVASFLPIQWLVLGDALSFLVSAAALLWVRGSFNPADAKQPSKRLWADVVEGVRYVIAHPVLRAISAMMALINLVGATVYAQIVFFAKVRLSATDTQVGILFAAGSLGVIVLSLLAGPLRRRFSFSQVALGALTVSGLATVAFAFTTRFWLAALLWSLSAGLGTLFNINTGSLRQAIVPNHLLGRIITVAAVLAWSAIPIGNLSGGLIIQATGNVVLVFAAIGALRVLIPIAFSFTALGRAERYLPERPAAGAEAAESAAGPR